MKWVQKRKKVAGTQRKPRKWVQKRKNDADTQRKPRKWVQKRKKVAGTQRKPRKWVQKRKKDAGTQRKPRKWVQERKNDANTQRKFKGNSSPPQKALRVDIFPKERYNSWKKAPMEESSHGRKIPFAEGHRRQLWIYLNI